MSLGGTETAATQWCGMLVVQPQAGSWAPADVNSGRQERGEPVLLYGKAGSTLECHCTLSAVYCMKKIFNCLIYLNVLCKSFYRCMSIEERYILSWLGN